MTTIERELKLRPRDPALLDRLAAADQFGEFRVSGRRHEQQRNSFFDTPSHALSRARLGFRRRVIAGQSLATWTLKSDSQVVRGVATRAEIEVQLDSDTPPVLALQTLREAARQGGAAALAEDVADALSDGSQPLATAFLDMQTDRQIVDLDADAQGWSVELALDRVRLVGHAYAELEIEAELKRGTEAALDAIRTTIESLGEVDNSQGGKLSRALAHLDTCDCPPQAA